MAKAHAYPMNWAGEAKKYCKIGKCLEENPDLTCALVKEMLVRLQELNQSEKQNTGSTEGMKV